MLLRRALLVARHGLAHPFPIYEMGSNTIAEFSGATLGRDE